MRLYLWNYKYDNGSGLWAHGTIIAMADTRDEASCVAKRRATISRSIEEMDAICEIVSNELPEIFDGPCAILTQ